ncbi:MAG: ISNCY family transposase [Pseudomonadales bacterium]|nr:ISNCY family transposase [Pseudomonadales bacterium]
MQRSFNPQLELGAIPIEEIKFNPRSRDDIPQILRGLQFIYTCSTTRQAVFEVLQNHISGDINFDNGRPGMDLWVLLVLGTLRLGLNCDYDRLHDLANEHKTIRAMLGHGDWRDEHLYGLQTLRDNVVLLTEEMLQEINAIIVKAGHALVKKKEDNELKGRCDSFVVETHVEYPTDTGMLWDAMRKSIILIASLCQTNGVEGWRQASYNILRLKSHWRKAQRSNRSRQANAQEKKKKSHKAYLRIAHQYFEKTNDSIQQLQEKVDPALSPESWSRFQDKLEKIRQFQDYAAILMDQINRRVLEEESIPSEEKIYSIFQPHTESISKGKAGVPVELGIKVCIMEDQHQFILYHQVMEKLQDVDVAVPMVTETQKHFPSLNSCSFDKGFHSPSNQVDLCDHLEQVVLPKKGRLSSKEKIKTSTPDYKKVRRQHSAVESAINALEQHGLDRCPDHGVAGFRRYVALSVFARNLQRIGTILTEKERAKLKRKQRWEPYRQVA